MTSLAAARVSVRVARARVRAPPDQPCASRLARARVQKGPRTRPGRRERKEREKEKERGTGREQGLRKGDGEGIFEKTNPVIIQDSESEMRGWSDSETLDERGGNMKKQDIAETHRAVKRCCTSCNETVRHSRGLEADADQSPSNSRPRVQGGPLTNCGMATRRTQTSSRGRRARPRDRAKGGSQIRVVDPKPGTRTRGHTHAH